MLVQCWLLFHWLYFGLMLTIVSLTVFWFDVDYYFTDCILVWNNRQHWIKIQSVKQVNIEAKYSQWNNSQHRTKIQSVKQVNIEPKYSQWNNSQHSLTVFWLNVDYCFTDCILIQCWLLFHWLFWFNVDYCFTDCILLQCWLVSLTVFWFNMKH
jgi:hypothetical protein